MNCNGWCDDVIKMLIKSDYDGVIGMGRVILEAASINMPIVLLGYGGLYGSISRRDIYNIAKTNFTCFESTNIENAIKSINEIYTNPKNYMLKDIVMSDFNSEKIWKNYYGYIKKFIKKRNRYKH